MRREPFPSWPAFGEAEEKSLWEVLRSRSWGGYNENVRQFEEAFAALHQVRYAVSCANGTVALEVALRAVGIQCGDEVIVPPFTFVSTATSALLCHGVPVFADIDRTSLNLSPDAAKAAITSRTRAIVAVHFGGHPADMDALTDIAGRRGIALVEDAAHAHGATWRDIPVGNFGAAATFSFQAFKLMTSGEGGAVLTNSHELAEKMWGYCNHGRRKGSGWYEHFTLGSNYRITGFQAALLCAQLEKLPEQIRIRAENVHYLRQQLRGFPGITLPEQDPRVGRHPHYLVTLRYDREQFEGIGRNLFIQALQAEGIPALPTYGYPLYKNPLFGKNALPPCRCGAWKAPQEYETLFLPESERICREGIWLEHHLFLGSRKDVDDILAAMEKVRRCASALRGAHAPEDSSPP